MLSNEVLGYAWLAIAIVEAIVGYATFAATPKEKIYDPMLSCMAIPIAAILFPTLWLARAIKLFVWTCQQARPELYPERLTVADVFLLRFDGVPQLD